MNQWDESEVASAVTAAIDGCDRSLVKLSTEAAAAAIREDGIDILLD